MKLLASQRLRGLFSFNGLRGSLPASEPGTKSYTPSEIDCLRREIEENSRLAAESAAGRGYRLNPKIAAAKLS
jgi:hypothetical protein